MYWDFICQDNRMYRPKFITWAPIPTAGSVKRGQLNVASRIVCLPVGDGISSESGINFSIRPVYFYREKPWLTIEVRETLFAARQRKSTRQVAWPLTMPQSTEQNRLQNPLRLKSYKYKRLLYLTSKDEVFRILCETRRWNFCSQNCAC